MNTAARDTFKEYVREQVEVRIAAVLSAIRAQTGLQARRRDILGVLETQYRQAIEMFRVGFYPTTLAESEFRERMAIMEELLVELAAVPEG